MDSLNVKNINDEKIFNVIDPNGQGEVVNRIRPISISINQKAETINDETDSTINLSVYWNDTWKSILDLTFNDSLRQEYGKLVTDLTAIQKDIDMKQYKDAETKTSDFLKYVANLSSKYTAIPETQTVARNKNKFITIKAERNSVKATISDKLLNFMLKKFAKVNDLDYTKANECYRINRNSCIANDIALYFHSPELFQKQAYMTVVKDNKVIGSYKATYDQFCKLASKFDVTPQKLGYSKDKLAGYMKTAEVVMQNIFFDSVDEAKEWQEMVDEKKKEQAEPTPEGEETETTETTETKTKMTMEEGKSESPAKEEGGLARPSEDFASDEIPESEPRQQEQTGQGMAASRRLNLLKKRALRKNSYTVEENKKVLKELEDMLKNKDQYYSHETIKKLIKEIKREIELQQSSSKIKNVQKKAEEKLYKYEELSEDAKENVRSAFSEDDHSWWYEEEQAYILKEKYAQYNVELKNLDIEWDNYNRCTVNLKDKFAYWDAFRTIWVDCAKQVLKDLPMFAKNSELLEDWATEAASDMYFQHDHFEVYNGLNDIDDQDGMELSYTISDLCTKAYEEKVEPILSDIASDFEDILQKQEDYWYSDEYIKEECAVREILFDKDGNMVKEGKKRNSLRKKAHTKTLKLKRKANLNKKAIEGDIQEQDIVPAKTETKVYLQSETNKCAGRYKEKVAEMLIDIDDPTPLMNYISESEAKEICEELDIPHEAEWYKGDLLGYIGENPNGMVDVLMEYISESDAKALWSQINIGASQKTQVKKQAEENIEEKIEQQVADETVKDIIGVGDIVTVCVDKLESPEEAFKYTELIGEPLILMDNDKENIDKVIVEQTEYPYQRMTVNKDDIALYDEVKGEQVIVEDEDGDEIITELAEVPVVAKSCKIKAIRKAARKNINKKAERDERQFWFEDMDLIIDGKEEKCKGLIGIEVDTEIVEGVLPDGETPAGEIELQVNDFKLLWLPDLTIENEPTREFTDEERDKIFKDNFERFARIFDKDFIQTEINEIPNEYKEW